MSGEYYDAGAGICFDEPWDVAGEGPDSGDGGHDVVFAFKGFTIIRGMLKKAKGKLIYLEGRVRMTHCVNKELLITSDYFGCADLAPTGRPHLGNASA